MELGQLQAEHGTPLLPLAGVEPGLVFIEPHLDIVALRSDSCLSAPNLFVARLAHRDFELLANQLRRRLTDPNAGGPVAEIEPLAVIAQLAMEGGGNWRQLQQASRAPRGTEARRAGSGDRAARGHRSARDGRRRQLAATPAGVAGARP